MRRLFWIFIVLIPYTITSAQDSHIESFIREFIEVAVQEMHRTGIPASIKIAQGILESDAGKSELAHRANNLFGLKCGATWHGDTFFKKDDDRDRRGRLIPSCFRVFNSPEESFIAHSEFLMDPNKDYRYGWLFNLDTRDYKSWAWGLKESGYATNPRYAVLLIKLIEDYQLYSFDYYEPKKVLVKHQPPSKPRYNPTVIQGRKLQTTEWKRTKHDIPVIDGLVENNGLEMAYARQGDTPEMIARRYGKSMRDILEYNEGLRARNQVLTATERVYFDRKKRSYKGSIRYHHVEPQQTMYEIAQTYGIQLEKLYNRNRMYPGTEPAAGEKIKLRGMIKMKNKPKLRQLNSSDLALKRALGHRGDYDGQRKSHVVSRGETLFQISHLHKISVDDLRAINNLNSDVIKPGQVLFID